MKNKENEVGETQLSELIKGMSPKLNHGEYVFASVTEMGGVNRSDTICEFREQEGTTLVLARKKADELKLPYNFVAAWITLMVHSSLKAVGLTAAVSAALANNNISCNIIAGFFHDHIFVDKKDAERAINILKHLSENFT